ncbi:hypothetical protein [Streptomyces sp. NPDC057403]|uniref:hypothetical protein n=1 Tax=Streptomyces sp. NPDC057403 TaxID=3346119 RepID=UPI0036AA81DA
MRVLREERQALKGTGPKSSWCHESSEFWSTYRRVPGRTRVGVDACMGAWFDDNTRGPVPGFVTATRMAELLRTELIERLEEATDPLSPALKPLWAAFSVRPGRTCCTGKAQESALGQEDARLFLPADSHRADFPAASACSRCYPYTAHAVFEGVPKERTSWALAGLLVAGKESRPGGPVGACAVDEQAIVETEPCRYIGVSRSHGEIVLRMDLSDLAQFLDGAREDTDTTNEHDRLGRPAHSMGENADDRNALHRMPFGDALLVQWLNDARRH